MLNNKFSLFCYKTIYYLKIIWYNVIVNIGVSPSGKASDSDSDIPVFESQYPSQLYITYFLWNKSDKNMNNYLKKWKRYSKI